MKQLYTLFISILVSSLAGFAFDFESDNADGKTIYYNQLNDHEVEVTYHTRFRPTEAYEGLLEVPESITIGSVTYTVTAIGDNALFNCRNLSFINMPSTVKTIGSRAFAWCDALTEITIPKEVAYIGNNVFDGCYSLACIKVERGNKAYTSEACALYSAGLNSLVAYTPAADGVFAVHDGTETIGPSAFGACTFLTDIVLPDGLKSIEDNAFYFCNFLNGVTVPESVTHIGHAAFSDCLSLEYIDVAEGNMEYASHQGVLLSNDMTRLIQSPGATLGLAKIPDGVLTVGEQAFFRNYSLTTVKLPASVSVIEEAAFIDCPKLSSVEIPSSVKHIGAMAFALCPSLASVYVDAANPDDISLGENVFCGMNRALCTLYVPNGSEQLYANAPQWREFTQISATDALKEQSIDWNQPTDTLDIGNQLRFNAASTSKLPVKYALSVKSQELANLDGNLLTVTAPGTIYVTAFQPGNVEYKPAVPVTMKFEASIAGSPDIVADSSIKVYGSYGSIVIAGADDSDIAEVFDPSGILIYAGTDRNIRVDGGKVYIVRIAGLSFKVAVM